MSEKQEQKVSVDSAANHKEKKSRNGLWFGITILLLILILAASGFYLLQQLRVKQEDLGGEINKDDLRQIELSKQITGYQEQLAAVQSQLATLEAEITGKDNYYNKKLQDFSDLHQDKLGNTQSNLQEEIIKIRRQLGKTRGDWLISDAEYLLSVANRRLHLMRDVKTTKEALVAADQRLRESGDAAAYKVREQIAKEIAALKNIQVPDIVGIYAKLEHLEDEVEKLSVFLPYAGKAMTKSEHKHEDSEVKHEHDMLDKAIVELEGLVTIRHTKQAVKAILTPEQAHFIRDQLRVKLEMVKISMVQLNDPLYKASLADAKNWVEENFSRNADADSFVEELNKLNAIEINSQLPDISQSLKMLRDITKLRIETDKHLKPSAKPKPSSGTEKNLQPQANNNEKLQEQAEQKVSESVKQKVESSNRISGTNKQGAQSIVEKPAAPEKPTTPGE